MEPDITALAQSPPTGRQTMSSGLLDAHNYHDWTFEWVRPFLEGGRILDIGSGTANHLHHLPDREVVSIDLDEAGIRELRQRFAGHDRWRFECLDITRDGVVERLGPDRFDVVFSSNVFEHIQDDVVAFRNAARLLRPGGRLVLVLPAHQLLFGRLDRLAGHYRRYDRASIRQHLAAVELEVVALRYVNMLGAIGWFVNSRLLDHSSLSSAAVNTQIRLFDRFVIPLLRRLEARRALPFGQSLVAVGRKPLAGRPPT